VVSNTDSKERTAIPLETKEKLLLYCRHECCLCDKKVSGAYERNIHHINKDRNDNRFENLTLLCPNCHALATRGDFTDEHLKTVRDAKIQKLGIKEFVETREEAAIEFKTVFSLKLENLCQLLEREIGYPKVNDQIDELIMLAKERIEKWDVPSVRFATEELFMKLYKRSEQKGFCELYIIFEDLFSYAHSQWKYILGVMISVFSLILFGSWVPDYDIEKGEKAAKVMLRLGMDFLDKDLPVSEDCLTAIDNLAGDMFEPEIFSKEILLGSKAFQKSIENPKLQGFLEQTVDWIRINDQYAWEDGNKAYLRDSIRYAEWEQEKYDIDLEIFKKKFLFPALEQNISEDVHGYVDFLGELESEGDRDVSFPAEELSKMILAFEFLRPNIAAEIKKLVEETKNSYIANLFKRIVDSSNLLRKIYGESDMITTFEELIRFLEMSSDLENLGVGVTTYNFSMIDFIRKLKKEDEEVLMEVARKYGIEENFEITENGIHFEMDSLVYKDKQNNMKRLIEFLKELNGKFRLKNFSAGITFELRETVDNK
jgi:hypothetical protein